MESRKFKNFKKEFQCNSGGGAENEKRKKQCLNNIPAEPDFKHTFDQFSF